MPVPKFGTTKYVFIACLLLAFGSMIAVFILQLGLMRSMISGIQITKEHFTNSLKINGKEKTLRRKPGTKMIMFWTTRGNRKNWFGFSEAVTTLPMSRIAKCSNRDCIFTSNHSRIKEADMVLFYQNENHLSWPPVHYPQQDYGHYIIEAPCWNRGSRYLDQYEGKINLTINFRYDADVYAPYNAIVPVKSVKTYKPGIPHEYKTKMVVWPVSHCLTLSHREDYVTELSRYIDVDIYGACGKRKCRKYNQGYCMKQWEREYMFYISFENCLCEDYITEKTFRPLQYEIIPVVLGGGNYSRDVPPHSVINARDFNSPKDLADFLTHLAADEQRYRSYFKWKTHYRIVGGVPQFLCRLCNALHEDKFPRPLAKTSYADYWLGSNGERCDNNLVPSMKRQQGWKAVEPELNKTI
ncbi:hypothetical protein LSH36_120g12000 [Paralvinella palmiformis]|uniref:Fucosyltransferase n=1 Tax=Paralvinella palmiformis TaxID=53620 RepID=A0AAD9JYS8_9ANNE|nr:hypothetical protein LSH36_120g12000 [Paralvinella palmiformis]